MEVFRGVLLGSKLRRSPPKKKLRSCRTKGFHKRYLLGDGMVIPKGSQRYTGPFRKVLFDCSPKTPGVVDLPWKSLGLAFCRSVGLRFGTTAWRNVAPKGTTVARLFDQVNMCAECLVGLKTVSFWLRKSRRRKRRRKKRRKRRRRTAKANKQRLTYLRLFLPHPVPISKNEAPTFVRWLKHSSS